MSNRGKVVIQGEEACRNSEDIVKAEIVSHPLFNDLLAAHVACLRFATPFDQQHIINSQIASHVPIIHPSLSKNSNQELDQVMTCYTTMIFSLDKQLRHHTMEAKTALQSIEMELFHLTGAKIDEEIKAQPSDWNGDVHNENDQGSLDIGSAGNEDTVIYGSSFPTGFEGSLTERTKHELRLNLQQGLKDYEMKIKHVREEILRKRRASKLTGDTSILKKWWDEHSDWPYPTDEEKEMFIMETGLKLKQINKWFTNQRNRNWD